MGKQITEYYTSLKHLADVYDRVERKMPAPVDSLDDFKEWQQKARRQLHGLLSLDQYESCPLNPEVLESVQMEGYRRDKIIIQTEPDVYMTLYALIPDDIMPGEKRPAFLIPPGHGPGKFGTVRDIDYDGVKWMSDRLAKLSKKSTLSPF